MVDKVSSGIWWLRTPNSNNTNNAWNVNTDGTANNNNTTNDYGVVPAIGYKTLGRPSKRKLKAVPFIFKESLTRLVKTGEQERRCAHPAGWRCYKLLYHENNRGNFYL